MLVLISHMASYQTVVDSVLPEIVKLELDPMVPHDQVTIVRTDGGLGLSG